MIMGKSPTSTVRAGSKRKRTVPSIASNEGTKTPLNVPNFFIATGADILLLSFFQVSPDLLQRFGQEMAKFSEYFPGYQQSL